MRVIVHQRSAAGRKTGVGYYTSRLLEALRAQAGPDEVDSFPDGWIWTASRSWSHMLPILEECRRRSKGLHQFPAIGTLAVLPRMAWRSLQAWGREMMRRQYRLRFFGQRYDVYHEPNFIPLHTNLPTVVTLHDLSVLLHPDWHPRERVRDYERRFHHGVKNCQHFLTVSETVRAQVIRILNIPRERVTRVYNGVHPH